jgi:hypothetical protein
VTFFLYCLCINQIHVPAVVVFHKRFPPHRNLIRMLHQNSMCDPWWREHLVQMHITPQLVSSEAHLTLVLEGSRESLGVASDKNADMYERPLLYFCPSKCKGMQRQALETSMRLGFGVEGEGYATTKDRDDRDILVVKRPPLVAEEDLNHDNHSTPSTAAAQSSSATHIRLLYTFVLRNPGRCIFMPALQRNCRRFRILFQPATTEVYAKFELQPAMADLLI